MTVPYIFANQSGQVPASELDANFAVVSQNVNTANTVVNPAQANITSVGTLTTLSVTGNITTSGFLVGNIAGEIANAVYANTAGYAALAGTANSATTAGSATVALTAGTVSNAAQPAITSVGTLTLLNVTGIVAASNFSGSGNTLTDIPGANVTGTVANSTYSLTANSATFSTNAIQANVANIANSVAGGNVSGQVGNALVAGTVYTNAQPNITSVGTLGNVYTSGVVSAVGNVRGGNLNTVGLVTATGNVTGGNLVTSGNVTATGNIIGGNIVTNDSIFSGQNMIAGGYITATTTVFCTDFSATGNVLAKGFRSNTSSWTLSTGTNTVSFSVPGPGTYSLWVNGNIPNGIVTYLATVVVTNNNVPVLGNQYGWYYAAGNALVLTSIPNQIVGNTGTISNAVVATTTANVFTFGITNNSGNSAVVNYGYTTLS